MSIIGTKVYGASDNLIEFEGDVRGEIGYYDSDETKTVALRFSDGTLLSVFYGKNDDAIWAVKLIQAGSLFVQIEECFDEDAKIYSDIAYFKSGLEWADSKCPNEEWEKVS